MNPLAPNGGFCDSARDGSQQTVQGMAVLYILSVYIAGNENSFSVFVPKR